MIRESLLVIHHSSLRIHHFFYAFSSPAYFSTSFFWPKPGKLTRSLAESPVPSRRSTRPRPYLGWRTCVPGTKPAPVEDEGGGVPAPRAGVPRVVASGRGGVGRGSWAFGCADCL